MPRKTSSKGKLIFLTNLALPVLCLVFIRPEWAGRLVAVAACFLFLTVVLLVYGFRPRSEFLHRNSKLARSKSDRTKRNARRVIRGMVILSGVFLLVLVDRPILEDCASAIRLGRSCLVETRGRVDDNDMIFGLYFLKQSLNIISIFGLYFLKQSLIIKEAQRSDGYTAMFFPRLARVGTTYDFLIAPKSKVVLDWSSAGK